MHRAVETLGGGFLGFVVGSFFCAPLIAHVFGPTTVTWDASACPAGVYTITSTATSLTDSRSFTATTQHIRLPRPSIVQDFGDLPSGQYQVSAVVRDARGRTLGSGTQTIVGQGQSRGRQVTASNATGSYSSRAVASTASATVKTVQPLPAPAPAVSVDPPANVPQSAPQSARLSTSIRDRLLADTGAELLAAFPQWKSIAFVDTDDDGVMDSVRIELTTGEVWFASFQYQYP
jgi:hypothetical protein